MSTKIDLSRRRHAGPWSDETASEEALRAFIYECALNEDAFEIRIIQIVGTK